MREDFCVVSSSRFGVEPLAIAPNSGEDAQQQTGTSSDVSMAVVVAGTLRPLLLRLLQRGS